MGMGVGRRLSLRRRVEMECNLRSGGVVWVSESVFAVSRLINLR
jgi:hypothetical protein